MVCRLILLSGGFEGMVPGIYFRQKALLTRSEILHVLEIPVG
jgi:hypothetical protein